MIPRRARSGQGQSAVSSALRAPSAASDLGDDLRARRHAGHVLGRLRVGPLGDACPSGSMTRSGSPGAGSPRSGRRRSASATASATDAGVRPSASARLDVLAERRRWPGRRPASRRARPASCGRRRGCSCAPSPGHSTLTPTGSPADLDGVVQVLADRHDGVLRRVVARGRSPGISPAIDAVLTMWPPPARCGRNVRQPCTTPQKLTPITHSHELIGPNHGIGPGRHAGVVAHDVHGAEALERPLREGLHVGLLADVGVHGQHLDAAAADLLGRRGERVVLHVGEHEVQAGARRAARPAPARSRCRRR